MHTRWEKGRDIFGYEFQSNNNQLRMKSASPRLALAPLASFVHKTTSLATKAGFSCIHTRNLGPPSIYYLSFPLNSQSVALMHSSNLKNMKNAHMTDKYVQDKQKRTNFSSNLKWSSFRTNNKIICIL